MGKMKVIIDKNGDGMLLRSYLTGTLGISHRLLSLLKKREDGIVLNGKRVTVRASLREGDVLSLNTEDENASSLPPTEMRLDILYEDDNLLVINKPPYLPTHPSINHYNDTLANGVAYYFDKQGRPTVFRPITRLDKNTSGVVLIAKNAHSAKELTECMQEGRIEKSYLAVAVGKTDEFFAVERNIKREKDSIITRVVCPSSEGRYAHTEFIRINTFDSPEGMLSLLRITPITGRTHQIRVHLASVSHPIIGDDLYGTPSSLISRHALHAEGIKITYKDGTQQSFTAAVPEDMAKILNHSKKEQNEHKEN